MAVPVKPDDMLMAINKFGTIISVSLTHSIGHFNFNQVELINRDGRHMTLKYDIFNKYLDVMKTPMFIASIKDEYRAVIRRWENFLHEHRKEYDELQRLKTEFGEVP